ncbi:DNA topoisomerase type IA zn finger domain protein [Thermovibrio ammonificans]|uniref:DNA topoisomerase type IA zn finger domain protein n=1 Tax=Thermovibrio ammonificans (strain DSM 15698 / JCM 12110 / HB-1) TaxID=648996 RepID=E8T1V2_THEA1|nr:DNA topoisomerase type IA zn finger domain protein [Thermovibrio ammonificans]ADU96847.1 DNA topoisomerase type IA zn finger domain protein [Thermovibrio ammonificans HB-1]
MEFTQKTNLFPYPDLFVFVDRICPVCGSPLSVKRVNGKEFVTCTNNRCNYFENSNLHRTERGETL